MTDDFVVSSPELGQCWKRVSFALHILRRLNRVLIFVVSFFCAYLFVCHTHKF